MAAAFGITTNLVISGIPEAESQEIRTNYSTLNILDRHSVQKNTADLLKVKSHNNDKIHQVLTHFSETPTHREFQYNIHHEVEVLKTHLLSISHTADNFAFYPIETPFYANGYLFPRDLVFKWPEHISYTLLNYDLLYNL